MPTEPPSHPDDAPAGGVDAAHDPGVDAARARAEDAPVPRAVRIDAGGGHEIRVGTAGWTDPTLTAAGVFYPPDASTPETRLRYYASRFAMVEVDAPYYALPSPRNAQLWAERTPPDFVFDVKAHALMTGHPSEVSRLPKELRDALPADVAAKKRVYPHDLPPEVRDAVWRTFADALRPLQEAGKMGAVLLQYPRWFLPNAEAKDALLEARERLPDVLLAVEFRNRRWLTPKAADRVLRFLSDQGLAYVVVDEPQGLPSSVPPIVAATSPELAVVRMHGRRGDQWERRGASVADKYRYLYDHAQLEEWAPKVAELSQAAARTHVVFNNCYGNYGTTNALEMTALLSE